MNEPYAPGNPLVINDHPELSEPFLRHFIDFVQEAAQDIAILIGVANQNFLQVSTKCDILSFHCYDRNGSLKPTAIYLQNRILDH